MKRIASLDMLRGYALVCIMLDHMPISPLRNFTLANFVVFDAAELFVLLSGFLVGLVWIKVEARQGLRAAQWRFLKRAFQVWRALIIGAVILALLSWLLFQFELKHTAVWSEYSKWIIHNPFGYIATVALMWMQPNLMDVLALYVLLIATAPLMVPALLRWPLPTLAVSVLIWIFAEQLNALIPNQRPGPGLLFNPFGWQLLFFCGVAMGAFRIQIMERLRPHATLVTVGAAVVVLLSSAVVLSWRVGPIGKPLHEFLTGWTGPIDKWSLDGVRLAAILAASWLVAAPLAPIFDRMASTRLGVALAEIGRGGLWAFIACVLLSIWGDALDMTVANDSPARLPVRLAIDLWVIVALWAMSAAWLRREEWLPRRKAG